MKMTKCNIFEKSFLIILLLYFAMLPALCDAQSKRFVPGEIRSGQDSYSNIEQGCIQQLGADNYAGYQFDVRGRALVDCFCHSNPGAKCAGLYTYCKRVQDVDSWGICQVAFDTIDAENAGPSCAADPGAGADEGNPINVLAGNKHQTEIDYDEDRSIFPLRVIRTYNSLSLRSRPWSFSFDHSLQIVESSDSVHLPIPNISKHITYKNGVGRTSVFHKLDTGVYKSLDSPEFIISESASASASGYRLNKKGSIIYDFNEDGLIQSIKSNGVTQRYLYDAVHRIERIEHQNGSYLRLGYVNSMRSEISEIYFSSADGIESLILEYDGFPNITDVRQFKGGELTSRKYIYEKSLLNFDVLKAILDEDGHTYTAWDYDEEGRAAASYRLLKPCLFDNLHTGNNCKQVDRVDIDYSNFEDEADRRVTVRNSLQKQMTYHFEIFRGVRKITRIEGHQSANCAAANKNYTYYPNGLLQTKTDWQGSTTSYQYNARNLESSHTEAVGTPQERTITTEWHPTFNLRTKITEPGKETIFTYDTEGRLVSQSSIELPID